LCLPTSRIRHASPSRAARHAPITAVTNESPEYRDFDDDTASPARRDEAMDFARGFVVPARMLDFVARERPAPARKIAESNPTTVA
jgi:hypothetical protein